MGRKPDPARRERLLTAAASYLEQRGLAALSLRPLGKALGVSPRTLLYHFGSKERLVAEALGASPALREASRELAAPDAPLFARLRRLWERTTDPAAGPYLALFFEVYAAALRDPTRYAAFLASVVDGWLEQLVPLLESGGVPAADARTTATELLALHHGCTLDLLATGDRDRVTRVYLSRLRELEAGMSTGRPEPAVRGSATRDAQSTSDASPRGRRRS